MNPFAGQKIFNHAGRIAEWQKTGDTKPVTMELDMTNRCTDKCPCCAGGRYKDNAEQEWQRIDSLIPELGDFGVKGLIFTGGGEPLCHKDTPPAMREADNWGMDVGLITNLVPFKPDMWDAGLCAATWIRISLDAARPDTYEKTHGTKNFERVLDNIRELVRLRKETPSVTDVTIGIGFLVGENTVSEMDLAARVCAGLGVDYLQFRPFHHTLNNGDMAQRALEGFAAAQQYSTDTFSVVWSEHKFRHMLHSEGEPDRPYAKCYGQAFAGVIAADGNMYTCCHLRGNPNYAFGNIYKNSVEEIWQSQARKDTIDNINFKDCVPLCRCDVFNRTLWDLKHHVPDHVSFL